MRVAAAAAAVGQDNGDVASQYFVNRSRHALEEHQTSVLDKELTFVPFEPKPKKKRLINEFYDFARALRIKYLINNPERFKELKEQDELHPFRRRSNWRPEKSGNDALEAFIDATRALIRTRPRKPEWSNTSIAERRSVDSLALNRDLVIRKADKVSSIVLEDKETYVRQGTAHVTDSDVYQPLPSDPA